VLIYIADSFDPSLPEKLGEFGEVTTDGNRLSEADVLLVRSKTKVTREVLEAASRVKLVIRGGVGIDTIDTKAAAERGVRVRNTPKASSITVAELAFALMLAAPTRLIEAHISMCQGKWEKNELKRTELFGKTLTLVGLGNIASEVAKRAQAFGMTVFAYDPLVSRERAAELGVALVADLEEALSKAHYVSIHVPLVDSTRNLINRETLSAMRKGAVLVNTARAGVIVAEDVVEALESGQLAYYCADVWPTDPPSPDYPILKSNKVFMLPHLGASSKENLLRIGEEVCSIIRETQKEGVLQA
jgi:D-3-phosphoglycerate dehydrogenase